MCVIMCGKIMKVLCRVKKGEGTKSIEVCYCANSDGLMLSFTAWIPFISFLP